ncbi:MAG: tRNA (guanosine(37)-N1)-methyltransferase TrmD [Myxococcales bacterium]|nr:tRNA (guanosine(37)-N1)-methyltransferase TrmD [Myxococcales bacterium]
MNEPIERESLSARQPQDEPASDVETRRATEPFLFQVLTLFREVFDAYLSASILGKAQQRERLRVEYIDIRDFTFDRHRTVDDTPFGGGSGMVMKPEPLALAIEAARAKRPSKVVLLTPAGRPLRSHLAQEWSTQEGLILVCGRYEGIDERIAEYFCDEQVSIGDYVLTGGELGAMAIIDAVSRFIPGVLGNDQSPLDESMVDGCLEYPHYTRPREFRGHDIPDVLLSGDHQKIADWRRQQSLLRTRARRPDLFSQIALSSRDRWLLNEADHGPGASENER